MGKDNIGNLYDLSDYGELNRVEIAEDYLTYKKMMKDVENNATDDIGNDENFG